MCSGVGRFTKSHQLSQKPQLQVVLLCQSHIYLCHIVLGVSGSLVFAVFRSDGDV